MKLHRFFVDDVELTAKPWIHEQRLLHQWQHVLRFKPGDQLILFDGKQTERLYKIFKIEKDSVGLSLVTELKRKVPAREVYLFSALLKKDNNDFVLQKGTELGVSHFVPILAERSVATSFNTDRSTKIVIEAAEQCGRSDIPRVREPLGLDTALSEFSGKMELFYAEQSDDAETNITSDKPVGIFVGPEGGFSDDEKQLLAKSCRKLSLHDFTLRAETASIAAAAKALAVDDRQ